MTKDRVFKKPRSKSSEPFALIYLFVAILHGMDYSKGTFVNLRACAVQAVPANAGTSEEDETNSSLAQQPRQDYNKGTFVAISETVVEAVPPVRMDGSQPRMEHQGEQESGEVGRDEDAPTMVFTNTTNSGRATTTKPHSNQNAGVGAKTESPSEDNLARKFVDELALNAQVQMNTIGDDLDLESPPPSVAGTGTLTPPEQSHQNKWGSRGEDSAQNIRGLKRIIAGMLCVIVVAVVVIVVVVALLLNSSSVSSGESTSVEASNSATTAPGISPAISVGPQTLNEHTQGPTPTATTVGLPQTFDSNASNISPSNAPLNPPFSIPATTQNPHSETKPPEATFEADDETGIKNTSSTQHPQLNKPNNDGIAPIIINPGNLGNNSFVSLDNSQINWIDLINELQESNLSSSTIGDDESLPAEETTGSLSLSPANPQQVDGGDQDLIEGQATSLESVLPDFTLESLEDSLSPQSKAYAWVSEHPDLDTMQVWRQRQLFSLATFYHSFESFSGQNNWLSYSTDECTWSGELAFPTCNTRGQYLDLFVTSASLGKEGIPEEVAFLTSLKSFGVGWSDLDGVMLQNMLPNRLSNTRGLQALQFDSNSLRGSIPVEISNYNALNVLSVAENKISGRIPEVLWNLRRLLWLDLYDNFLTGTISSQLGRMSQLKILDLAWNALTGTVPTEIGKLSSIRVLSLSLNILDGTVPSELGQLTDLEILDLARNQELSGPIPTEIGLMSSLQGLYLYGTNVEALVPETICQIPSLVEVVLNCGSLCPPRCSHVCYCVPF